MPDTMADVVLRSEARLVRSIEGYPFSGAMDAQQEAEILEAVMPFASDGRFALLPLSALSSQRKALLTEERLLPLRSVQQERENMAVALDRESMTSVLINGDEHFCFLAVRTGLETEQVLECVRAEEMFFAQQIHFAYDKQFGFLNGAVADVGTGFRLTVALHLPYLEKAKQAEAALKALGGRIMSAKMPLGSVYLIFNGASIGVTEEEISLSVAGAAERIAAQERAAREKSLLEAPEQITTELSCMREMLALDESLSEKDCMLNWSFLRQAVTAGALAKDLKAVDALLTASSPGHLDAAAGRELSADERGVFRLALFRDFIGESISKGEA